MKTFITEDKIEIPVLDGFREQVKSNWRRAFKNFEYTELELNKANSLKSDFKFASSFLEQYGVSVQDKTVMDIGCYLGLQCIAAAETGVKKVTGIDIPEYYVNQALNKEVNASKVLSERRDQVMNLYSNLDRTKIEYKDVSVMKMNYEEEYDILFSWETFEHIASPKIALERMYRALKPGGISFNVYNPFFSLSGGHSMCTLDYPFAHTLLTNSDFKRYVETIQPEGVPSDYAETAYNFYTKNLNRMTQQSLLRMIEKVGFDILDFIPIPDLNILNILNNSIVERAQSLYPDLSLNDFLSSYVYFILIK